jgi:hypothetical protein
MRQNGTTGKSPKPVESPLQKYFAFVVGQISGLTPPSHPMRGALRTSRTRGGMRWTRKACETRTPDVYGEVVWFGRRGAGAKLARRSASDGGKRAVLRGEHEVSRKATAQGRPGCSACTCMLVCSFVSANRTRDRGCSKHPVFPAPSLQEEGNEVFKPRAKHAARSRNRVRVRRAD